MMNRRLFGYLLVAALVAAALCYHFALKARTVAQPPASAASQTQGQPPAATAMPVVVQDLLAQGAGEKAQAGPVGIPAAVLKSIIDQGAPPGGGLDIRDGRLLVKLPNGLTLLVVEDKRFPLVAERLYVRAGSSYEKPEQQGISHLLEHMVFNSTVKRPKGGVASAIEGAGGDTNAATSFDYTQYMADLPSQHWRLGLDVFQDMIFGARFDPAELEQEKKVVISELERGLDDPGQRLFHMSQDASWKGSPYQHPIIGTRETIQAVNSDDLHAYIRQLYQPQSMLLVVVGDVSAREVYEEAGRVFGSLVNDLTVTPPGARETPVLTGGPQAKAVAGNWNKSYLRVSFAVPGLHSAKDVPLEVLANLLGGDKTSKFYRKYVYDLQLADDVDVSSITLERGGMLSIDATLNPERLDAFWAELSKDLAALDAVTFTDEELARAKLNIEDHLYRAKETLRGLATKEAYYQFFGYGPEGEDNVIYAVRNVDRAQLGGLIGQYLRPGNAAVSLLTPGKDQDQADARATAMAEALKAAWPAGAAASTQAAPGKAGEPEVVDLGNGRSVVLLPDPTMPYASVTVAFRGGDALLAPTQQGLAELASRALVSATTTMDAPKLEDFLADRAASIGASAGRDTFTLSARYPQRFAKDVLGALADVATRPALAQGDVERAKRLQLAQIAEVSDKPTGLAFRHLFPFLFPGSHYGYFRAGQPGEVSGFTPKDVQAFWERQRAMPWIMAVCGQFDRQMILDVAARLAAPAVAAAPPLAAPAWGDKREEKLTLAERAQTHLFWIFPVAGRESPDAPALEVLRTALAGQGGLLFQDLRDKQGLGYTVTAFLWQSPKTGFLAFYIGTTPDKAGQAMDGFQRIAADVAAKGLDEAMIGRAKNSIEGDYYQEHQSLGSRSQEAALNLAMGLGLNFDREMLARVAGLDAQGVADVAKKYLDPSKAYLMKIEP